MRVICRVAPEPKSAEAAKDCVPRVVTLNWFFNRRPPGRNRP